MKGCGRGYLLFQGPLDGVMAFLDRRGTPFWEDSPNVWWPEDRAWYVATDIDLYDTYVGGSGECIQAAALVQPIALNSKRRAYCWLQRSSS